jgi:ATP-dependent helicase HrpA
MREWMDIHRQLTLVMEDNGYRPGRRKAEASLDKKGAFSSRYAVIHRSILSGFLSHIARLEEKGVYEATRNRRVRIHPGSALHKTGAPWIMAAEIVRTSRLYARSVAGIDPEWLVDLGSDLASRNWVDPHWSRKAGAVMATEQMRLYGFLISGDRIIPYASVRPGEAREIFIRSALVEGDIADISSYPFLRGNMRLIRRLEGMEEKLRRRDLVAGEDAMASFYAQALPGDVVDLGTLNAHIRRKGEKHLQMKEEDLLTGVSAGEHLAAFPDSVEIAGEKWKLSYIFDRDSDKDGVSLKIPPGRLSSLTPDKTDWMVPGLLEEKVEALMRGLEKKYRRKLIPIPETAAGAMAGMNSEGRDLIRALSEWLYRERGIDIPLTAWHPEKLPVHLQVRFSLLDDSGRELASGRDPSVLTSVKTSQADRGRSSRYRKEHERTGFQSRPESDLPESVLIPGGALLWPAFSVEGETAALRYFDSRSEAERSQLDAQAWFAERFWNREIRDFRKNLRIRGDSRLTANYIGGATALEDALWDRVIRDIFSRELIRDKKRWDSVLKDGGSRIYSTASEYLEVISGVLDSYGQDRKLLLNLLEKSHRPGFIRERIADLENIVSGDFISVYQPEIWKSLPRWMHAVVSRARKGSADPLKDRKALEIWEPVSRRLDSLRENLSPMAGDEKLQALYEAGIMLEELKVALFATGDVRPSGKISESRMLKKMDEIERML